MRKLYFKLKVYKQRLVVFVFKKYFVIVSFLSRDYLQSGVMLVHIVCKHIIRSYSSGSTVPKKRLNARFLALGREVSVEKEIL